MKLNTSTLRILSIIITCVIDFLPSFICMYECMCDFIEKIVVSNLFNITVFLFKVSGVKIELIFSVSLMSLSLGKQ